MWCLVQPASSADTIADHDRLWPILLQESVAHRHDLSRPEVAILQAGLEDAMLDFAGCRPWHLGIGDEGDGFGPLVAR